MILDEEHGRKRLTSASGPLADVQDDDRQGPLLTRSGHFGPLLFFPNGRRLGKSSTDGFAALHRHARRSASA